MYIAANTMTMNNPLPEGLRLMPIQKAAPIKVNVNTAKATEKRRIISYKIGLWSSLSVSDSFPVYFHTCCFFNSSFSSLSFR